MHQGLSRSKPITIAVFENSREKPLWEEIIKVLDCLGFNFCVFFFWFTVFDGHDNEECGSRFKSSKSRKLTRH